jgi:GT2 family glycosyltransferase
VELGAPLPSTVAAPHGRYERIRVLVRLHGEPLGFVSVRLQDGRASTADILAAAPAAVHTAAGAHLRAETGTTPPSRLEDMPAPVASCPNQSRPGPLVSVVVCTRDRAAQLRGCLQRLRELTYAPLEVIVVDNAPSDSATRDLVQDGVGGDDRFRYLVEPRPGLSFARNLGVAAARGELIAYTDDDVSVDTTWVDALVRGFARRPDVGCVTGLVCTKSLDSLAETYFDARVSWGDNVRPRLYEPAATGEGALYPYSPGIFGTGANMAFRSAVLRRLGGFDVALGAGTRTAGGEDLDAFVRVLQAGYALMYEPSALVWHAHRADLAALRRQLYAYGTGLSAFLTKHLLDGRTRRQVLSRIPHGLGRMGRVPAATRRSLDCAEAGLDPKPLLLRELAGLAMGPLEYARSRRAAYAVGGL